MDPGWPRAVPNAPARLSEIDYVAHDGPRSVAVGERETRQPELTEPRSDQRKVDESEGQTRSTHLEPPFSEADDPKRFGSVPVQPRSLAGVPTPFCEVTQRDPRPRPVRDGRHLLERSVRGPEALLRLAELFSPRQRDPQVDLTVFKVRGQFQSRSAPAYSLVELSRQPSVIAHEVANPLTAALGSLAVTLDGLRAAESLAIRASSAHQPHDVGKPLRASGTSTRSAYLVPTLASGLKRRSKRQPRRRWCRHWE